MDKRKILSISCILAAGILWGCMGILVRTMKTCGIEAMEVVAFRAIITALCMLIGMLIFNRKGLKVRFKDLWCFVGTGIVSVVFFNLCYFTCINRTSLSTAAILLYTAPAFVIVMSFFLFKEKIGWKKSIALVMAFAGCVLVSGGFGKGSLGFEGLLWGLGAGIGYALYSIFGRYAIERGYSSFTITTYTFIFAAVGSVPFVKIMPVAKVLMDNPDKFGVSVILVIMTTVFAYLLYTKGLSGTETGKAAIIASIEPVMATVVGTLLYKEELTWAASLGMLLVLGSTVVCNIGNDVSK